MAGSSSDSSAIWIRDLLLILLMSINAALGVALICMAAGVFSFSSDLSIAAGVLIFPLTLPALLFFGMIDCALPALLLLGGLGVSLICMGAGMFDFSSGLSIASGVMASLPLFVLLPIALVLIIGAASGACYDAIKSCSNNGDEKRTQRTYQPSKLDLEDQRSVQRSFGDAKFSTEDRQIQDQYQGPIARGTSSVTQLTPEFLPSKPVGKYGQ